MTELKERLHGLADELRARGVPVSLVERIDAMRAVEVSEFDTRHGLHTALSATLIKAPQYRRVFDEVFDLYFRAGPPRISQKSELDLEDALRSYLREGDQPLGRLVAEEAVSRYVTMEPGRPVAGVFYERLAVRGLQLDQVGAELIGAPPTGRQLGFADVVTERSNELRQEIRDVIRELLIADRGVEAVAKTLRRPLAEDTVIMSADAAQLADIERLMRTLQRKIATTLMRKQRHRHGPLDVRATVRASMSSGGVPIRIVHHKPTPTKGQLYVLADMSGSVATFAAFTIMLVSGMSEVFSRLRTFAFVANTVEVTDLFRDSDNPVQAVKAINGLHGHNFLDRSTDYGRSLRQFAREVGPQLGRRSTVLIFGDARGNYLPPGDAVVQEIAQKAGAVYWLNPEQYAAWNSGDSMMRLYQPHCTDAISCRTLGDLRRFIENLA